MKTVKETTDYSMFKLLVGNRPIDETHVNRLMASFSHEYLISPIIVNSKFEIVDGQHRLEAAKRLKLPVYYIESNGYGLSEVQLLNTNGKNWGKIEFLNSYCATGIKSYLQLREFMKNFPHFGIAAAEIICTNNVGGANNKNKFTKTTKTRNFENGNLIISDLQNAYDMAHKITEYKEFYDGFARPLFVRTMIVLFKNPEFKHELLIKKLRLNPTSLSHCQSMEQYKLLIEKIYNFKNHTKVNLRYAVQ